MISPNQSRAGRNLINATQDDLSKVANVNKRTLMDFESGKREPVPATLAAIENGLKEMGVEMIPENGGGAGVRLAKGNDD